MAGAIPVQEGLFTTEDAPRLSASRCTSCGRHSFPRTTMCSYCGSTDLEDALLSNAGTLWAWTAVTAAPPGYRGEVPYGFGVVELPEGVRVITRLTEGDPAVLRFGQEVRMSLVTLHTDDEGREVQTWAFGP